MTGLILIACSLLLGYFLPLPAQNSLQHQKDSLRQAIERSEGKDKLKSYSRLYYLYMSELADDRNMDTLLVLFKETEAEAIRQGNVNAQGMVYGNTVISYLNRAEYDKVIQKTPGYLDFFIRHDLWNFYYQIHMQLISAYNLAGDYKRAAEEAEVMYRRAGERKDKAGMAAALYATGHTYHLQKRWKEEEDCFRECIGMLWEVSGYDNLLTEAYAFLCMSLRAQNHHDEILRLMPEYEKALARFEKAAGRIQPEARGNYYTALMNTYIDIKDYEKAEFYLSRFEDFIGNSITWFELLRAKALIYQGRGDYRHALAAIDSAIVEVPDRNFTLNEVRKIKMEILVRMGESDDAIGLFDEIIACNDSIKDVEINGRFDELRTRYEVEKYITEKERNFHYFLFAACGCTLLLIIFTGYIVYSHRLHRKNRILYRRIVEQEKMEERVLGAIEVLPLESLSKEDQLFCRLSEKMHGERLFTNPNLKRKDIAELLETNETYLSKAIRSNTEGKSYHEYVTDLRLKYASKLLTEHYEHTVMEIGESSGFNSPSTFFRVFRERFGMSPSDFRSISREK